MCVNDYRIKRKIISKQNTQANAIVKCASEGQKFNQEF